MSFRHIEIESESGLENESWPSQKGLLQRRVANIAAISVCYVKIVFFDYILNCNTYDCIIGKVIFLHESKFECNKEHICIIMLTFKEICKYSVRPSSSVLSNKKTFCGLDFALCISPDVMKT